MRKEKALDLAAFFAEFEQMMIKKIGHSSAITVEKNG